jgi:hypothetical protein
MAEKLILSDDELDDLAVVAMRATPTPHRVEGQRIIGPDGEVGEIGVGVRHDDEMAANAQLYAAAHRLLATAIYWRDEVRASRR